MAFRMASIRPKVALPTVRQAPLPPKTRATISCSRRALTGPKLVKWPDASIAASSDTKPLSLGGDGLSRGIFTIAALHSFRVGRAEDGPAKGVRAHGRGATRVYPDVHSNAPDGRDLRCLMQSCSKSISLIHLLLDSSNASKRE